MAFGHGPADVSLGVRNRVDRSARTMSSSFPAVIAMLLKTTKSSHPPEKLG
jgi:hypothetical protein